VSNYVRCYISDININTLKAVQTESKKFDEWELIQGSSFDFKESYGYQGVFEKEEVLLDAIAKRSVIAEAKEPESVRQSILWKNALNIADVITLLSLARAKYYSTLAVEKRKEDRYSISWGLITREDPGNHDIIVLSNLGNFISEALNIIESNLSYLEGNGFLPSIYWYAQAQASYSTSPTVLEMALYWISVEILSSVFVNTKCINENRKKEIVKIYIRERGYVGGNWGFMDELIDDWYATRNSVFHEGEQAFSSDKLKIRRQQVRDFTSLVLVEMLKPQDEKRKEDIARRIGKYQTS
jgi:hypothetical protein